MNTAREIPGLSKALPAVGINDGKVINDGEADTAASLKLKALGGRRNRREARLQLVSSMMRGAQKGKAEP